MDVKGFEFFRRVETILEIYRDNRRTCATKAIRNEQLLRERCLLQIDLIRHRNLVSKVYRCSEKRSFLLKYMETFTFHGTLAFHGRLIKERTSFAAS